MITFKAFILVTIGYLDGSCSLGRGKPSGYYSTHNVSTTFSEPMTKASCEILQRNMNAMGMQVNKNVQTRCVEIEFVKGN